MWIYGIYVISLLRILVSTDIWMIPRFVNIDSYFEMTHIAFFLFLFGTIHAYTWMHSNDSSNTAMIGGGALVFSIQNHDNFY